MKAKKILVSVDEYQAILAGIDELECTVGSGHLTDEELSIYNKHIKALENLINKYNK